MDIILDGLTIGLIGMAVVFAGLYILVGTIHLMSWFSRRMDQRQDRREGRA